MGCTQQAQVGPAVTEALGPQGHQCQAGKAICASNSREREEGLDNSQCSWVSCSPAMQMGKGKFTATAPLPVAPALSQVEQGDMG